MKKLIDPTMLKFLLVGVFNTLVGCGTMLLLYNWAGCSYWVSSAENYVVGGIISFLSIDILHFKIKHGSGNGRGNMSLRLPVAV